MISLLESSYARDSKILLDSGFYAVDSEFLELDSGLCFLDSSHWWESRFLELYSGFQKEEFLRFLIPQQAKISLDFAIRISYMERLVQIQSIIRKKKHTHTHTHTTTATTKTTKKLISLRFVIKRAKCFNFTEREIISHLREFVTNVKSYFPFLVAP